MRFAELRYRQIAMQWIKRHNSCPVYLAAQLAAGQETSSEAPVFRLEQAVFGTRIEHNRNTSRFFHGYPSYCCCIVLYKKNEHPAVQDKRLSALAGRYSGGSQAPMMLAVFSQPHLDYMVLPQRWNYCDLGWNRS